MQESLAFPQKRIAEENATLILNGSRTSVALEAAATVSSYLATINVSIIVKPNKQDYNLDEHSQLWNLNLFKLFCFVLMEITIIHHSSVHKVYYKYDCYIHIIKLIGIAI